VQQRMARGPHHPLAEHAEVASADDDECGPDTLAQEDIDRVAG
jgi:hypothetical protein